MSEIDMIIFSLEILGVSFVALGVMLISCNRGNGDFNQIITSSLLLIAGISIETLALTIYYNEKKLEKSKC